MRIIVGMSGGVDSSVAALLLKRQGHEVSGIFMNNWDGDEPGGDCPAHDDMTDAKRVCDQLDIELKSVNFSREYWQRVFQHFLAEHKALRTPNPDILCNKEIKFKAFLHHVQQEGAALLATGHYANIEKTSTHCQLMKAADPLKDQSYFLCQLNQAQLRNACFPLGQYQKEAVRAMAKEAGLVTHNKKDSTGICFIGERHFKSFLQQYLPKAPGPICSDHGEELGQHDGLMYYTIGQRGGMGIGGRAGSSELPWYVAKKEAMTNTLVVVQGKDHPLLYQQTLEADNSHWITPPEKQSFTCSAKIRYRQTDQPCQVTCQDDGRVHVCFNETQRAVTPGQSVVFYDGDYCLGSAVIFA